MTVVLFNREATVLAADANRNEQSFTAPADGMDLDQFSFLYAMLAYVARKHSMAVDAVAAMVAEQFNIDRVDLLPVGKHKDAIYFLSRAFVEPPMFQSTGA